VPAQRPEPNIPPPPKDASIGTIFGPFFRPLWYTPPGFIDEGRWALCDGRTIAPAEHAAGDYFITVNKYDYFDLWGARLPMFAYVKVKN
jgi:hypothetical protein